MKRIIILISILLCGLSVTSTAFAGVANVWASSDDAQIKADRKASSQTLEKVVPGTQLKVIKYEKRWYQVTSPSNKTGWIYSGNVSTEPVKKKEGESSDGSLGGLLSGLSGSNIQSDSADTSRSIRGLSPEAKEYAKQSGTPAQYQSALDSVTAIKITDQDINQFLKQGKIGEYAE